MLPDLARFSRDLSTHNLRPLWERVMRRQPGTAAVPAIWHWQDMRPCLDRAAELVDTKQAERRVLQLENPALRGSNFVSATLLAGLQIILPGETARPHRHTPNALRFVVAGHGAYLDVDGERIDIHPGDFVVTPGWAWHGHGNAGTEAVVWLDGLDVPLANMLGAYFVEDARGASEGREKTRARLRYPWDEMRERLDRLARSHEPHRALGFKLRYRDADGRRDPFPTIAAFIQRLPAGFSGAPYRATDSAVYCVVEGRGRVETIGGDGGFAFFRHDVFVIPSWCAHRFVPETECLLFSFSDRSAQEALGFWREEIEASNPPAV